MVLSQPSTKKLELKNTRNYGNMVSHISIFCSFIPVIHSNLFQNIPIAQRHFHNTYKALKKCYDNSLYKNICYYFSIIGFYPKKYSSPGNNLSNLEQNKK